MDGFYSIVQFSSYHPKFQGMVLILRPAPWGAAWPRLTQHWVFFFWNDTIHMGVSWNEGTPKAGFFPPLTLMPCDSGRDNQLRVKSPPMIVIINLTKKTNKSNKKQQIQGWRRDTPWDSRMHGCKMTDAGSNANECIVPGWIHRCRSVCPLRTEWHTHFPLFPHWGDKNRM